VKPARGSIGREFASLGDARGRKHGAIDDLWIPSVNMTFLSPLSFNAIGNQSFEELKKKR
jgi:hypothetical protein